jgi:hypothetical protein
MTRVPRCALLAVLVFLISDFGFMIAPVQSAIEIKNPK